MRARISPGSLAPLTALAACVAAAACAPEHYAPRGEIAMPAASLDVARQASRALQDRLDFDGDLHPNDLVRLSFPYLPDLTADQRVQLSGEISPPLLPPVQTRGLTTAQLQDKLVRLYRDKLDQPAVSVSITEYNRPPAPLEVFVMGEVAKPGAYPYRDGTSPFEGLARAGGGDRDADLSRVVLLSPEGDHLAGRLLDLRAVLRGDAASVDYLTPFSVLLVPPNSLAHFADRARQIRAIIGFNGVTVGSQVAVVSP